jgi:dTDP-4-dehydrorhamnose reductase
MRILLFGGGGQLGYEIKKRSQALNFEIVAPVYQEVDIANRSQVSFLAVSKKPEVIINCAAYTDVEKAEDHFEAALEVNAKGSGHIAQAARQIDAFLIHVSTDYVFNGKKGLPYTEQDSTDPVNAYGRSKLEGEKEVLSLWEEGSLILRTSSLHSSKGKNFPNTMLNLFKVRDEVSVVSDQIMSPTWAGWLAEVILDLARLRATGVYHAASRGAISWYDFAREIYELSASSKSKHVEIKAVRANEFQTRAIRPAYSVLDTKALEKLLGRDIPSWQEGLKAHLSELGYLS